MADQSTQSITIAAPAAAVMAVIADFARYPVWATSVKSAEVLKTFADGRAKRVAFAIDAGMAKDEYELSMCGRVMSASTGAWFGARCSGRRSGHTF